MSNLFSNNPDRLGILEKVCGGMGFQGRPYGIVWVSNYAKPCNLPFRDSLKLTKVLLIFEGLPVAVASLSVWREWAAFIVKAKEVHVEIVDTGINEQEIEKLIKNMCGNWGDPQVLKEKTGFSVGTQVTLDGTSTEKDNPDLLTATFGCMGELLTRIDWIRTRFPVINSSEKNKYLGEIDKCIGDGKKASSVNEAVVPKISCSDLPRLLLYGKTGVGKTLIARYLQNNPGERPVRIVIPEYLNKEDMFEYALFGYVKGAYTGGRESGDHGLLLENVGRVVFLDEIGEANDIIQAKLLAYLDDYHVRPRGWQGDPFYCPTLVVAATNRDLDDMVEKKQFRADLLMRFTDRETIPTLRERVDSFPFILDCLLQNNAINPGWGKKGESCVKEIGNEALEALKKYEFPGNFRELENILRTVCREVLKDGRDYICRSDLPICKCDE